MTSRKKQKFIAVLLAAMLTVGTATSAGIVVSAAGTSSATTLAEVSKASTSSDDFKYNVIDDETICITKYKGDANDVVIPSTIDGKKVTEIGGYAFFGYTALESVTIPNSVTKIGVNVFSGCTSLTSINVSEDNSQYSSVNGVLFNKDKTVLILYPIGENNTSYEIPNSVTTINDSAFSGCTSLESVTIPDSVTTINAFAFSCTSIKSITIPNSVTWIDYNAFSGCTSLKSITIPSNVTRIGNYAFSSCTSLTSINVSEDNNQYSSVNGVLFNKDKTVLIQYPIGKNNTSYKIPNSVTKIEWYAFSRCNSLKSMTIPNTVTEIGGYAFYDCPSLESVTIPNSVTTIYQYVFSECTALESITIPNSVTTINDGTFSGCTALESVTIPDSITWIGYRAFFGCTSLKNITVPNSVTTIEDYALGYSYFNAYEIIPGFTIYGIKGSAAEKYANDNSIAFKTIGTPIPLENTSKISATTITKGSSIKLTAKATGGTVPYKYKYYCKPEGDKNWTALTGSTTSKTFTHKPARAIKYQYAVKVADTKGKTDTKYFTIKVNNPLANTSTISATTITKGNSIKLTAKATGGTAPYKYKYYCKPEGDKNWTALTDSTTSTTFTHKPARAINYQYAVKVADAKGKTATKYFTVSVSPTPLSNSSSISATSIKLGDSIKLTGKATGGTAPYKYKYYCKPEGDKNWTALTSSTTSTTFTHKPARTIKYQYAVKIADAKGKTATKYFTIGVSK